MSAQNVYQHKPVQNGWYSFPLIYMAGTIASELWCGAPCMESNQCEVV